MLKYVRNLVAEFEGELGLSEIAFVHLAPDPERAAAAREAYESHMGGMPFEGAHFLVAQLQGEGCEHCSVVVLEDPAEMDSLVVTEAELIAAPVDDYKPTIIRVGKL